MFSIFTIDRQPTINLYILAPFSKDFNFKLILIQALVTGTIPGFVDVVLNFGSSVLNEDNLIGQLKSDSRTSDRWSINFFGDDTWIKLFPGHFTEGDGTTSFFVADFTEVSVTSLKNFSKTC